MREGKHRVTDESRRWARWANVIQQAPGGVRRDRDADHGRARDPVLLDAARLGRRGQRSRQLDHAQGLRPARQGLRSRATTARCSWSPQVKSAPSRRRSRASCEKVASTPGRRRLDEALDPPGRRRSCAGRDRQRLPEGLAAGRLDVRPAAEGARHGRSGRHTRHRAARARRRDDGDLRRLQPDPLEQAAAVHRDRRAAQLPVADGGVPQPADPADSGGHERALGRRGVRRRHGGVPVRLGSQPARHRRDGADRGVPAGADVPDPVRPLDGLRGVPDQPHLRGVAPPRRQPRGGHARSRRDRPHDHAPRR